MKSDPRTGLGTGAPTLDRQVDARAITQRHDALLQNPHWPERYASQSTDELSQWIDANHRCNALLWAQEDLARRMRVPDAEIVANKRAIDRYNQQRNDAIEKVDELLLLALGWLRPAEPPEMDMQIMVPQEARLNSETVGGMIDRLSILALKIKAMAQLIQDAEAEPEMRHAHTLKLQRLQAQRTDLSFCLDALWTDAVAGRACFKVYRQFKLYNNPKTNPALVAEAMFSASKG